MEDARIVRAGDGDVYDDELLFKHGSRTGAPFDFAIGAIEYLSGPPLHVHREQYDTFYVLDGVLAIQVGDEVIDLLPGDFASVPPGTPHTFDNIRKDQPPVKLCNVMSPGGLDEFIVQADEIGPHAAAEKMASAFIGPTIAEKLGLAK